MRFTQLLRFCVITAACPAFAGIVVAVQPGSQKVAPGLFSVDLAVSGLAAGTAPSVGAFEAKLSFDPAVVAFDSVSFSSFLGNPGTDSLTDVQSLFDSVDIASVSLLPTSVLDLNQPASFPLATLSFRGLGGLTSLSLDSVTLDDPLGLKLQFTKTNGTVTVTPEPSMMAAVAMGIGIALAIRQVRRSTH
jgi:hypothetical protein